MKSHGAESVRSILAFEVGWRWNIPAHLYSLRGVFVWVQHLKCGHQRTRKVAAEVWSFFSQERLVLRNWCAHRTGRDGVCVWWRTKTKSKDSWSFNEICKAKPHRFSAAWDSIRQSPVCLGISWSLRHYKQSCCKKKNLLQLGVFPL